MRQVQDAREEDRVGPMGHRCLAWIGQGGPAQPRWRYDPEGCSKVSQPHRAGVGVVDCNVGSGGGHGGDGSEADGEGGCGVVEVGVVVWWLFRWCCWWCWGCCGIGGGGGGVSVVGVGVGVVDGVVMVVALTVMVALDGNTVGGGVGTSGGGDGCC